MKKIEWGAAFCKIYLCYCIEDGEISLTSQAVLRKGPLNKRGNPAWKFAKKLTRAFGEVFDSMSDEERAELKAELLKGYEGRL